MDTSDLALAQQTLKLSNKETAQRIGVSPASWCNIRSGRQWKASIPKKHRAAVEELLAEAGLNATAYEHQSEDKPPPSDSPPAASAADGIDLGDLKDRFGGNDRRGPYEYAADEELYYLVKHDRNGEKKAALANFSATIAEEREYDDGLEVEHRSLIRARHKDLAVREVELPTVQFPSMNWVTSKLGHKHIVYSGQANKDHLRTAIQMFSDDLKKRHIYAHTGWRKLDDQWVYLHSGGGITKSGTRTDLEVNLPGDLSHYLLPKPPKGDDLVAAVRASLRQMDLADDGFGAVQLARIYAPPLASFYRLDVGIFALARTGTFKTECAALAMAHYGQGFNAQTLPESWESTENALTLKAHRAKDALFEIDDYNPTGGISDHFAMTKKADRLFRGAANKSGRTRLTSDIRLRETHYCRGMPSSSGEDLPSGRSLRARMWLVELQPGAVDTNVLTECQAHAKGGLFAAALAGYLQWLAPQVEKLPVDLTPIYENRRIEGRETGVTHERIPSNYACLMTGITMFTRFAEAVGALKADQAAAVLERCAAGLRLQAEHQVDIQEQSEDAVRFVELLRSGFTSGKVHVIDGESRGKTQRPTRAEQLGWTESDDRWSPRGDRIGYFVQGELWLDPEATYTACAKIARDQGSGALRSKIRMGKALSEKGYLSRRDGRHLTYKHNRDHIAPPRVWCIPVMRILGSLDDLAETPF